MGQLNAHDLSRGRILVVDDDETITFVLHRLLERSFDLALTTRSSQALDWIVRGDRFDVIRVCSAMRIDGGMGMPPYVGRQSFADATGMSSPQREPCLKVFAGRPRDVFPEAVSGRPWLSHDSWKDWDEPYLRGDAHPHRRGPGQPARAPAQLLRADPGHAGQGFHVRRLPLARACRRRQREVAASLQQAAAMRVPPSRRVRVYAGERALDPALTVKAASLAALDRVDVVPEK